MDSTMATTSAVSGAQVPRALPSIIGSNEACTNTSRVEATALSCRAMYGMMPTTAITVTRPPSIGLLP